MSRSEFRFDDRVAIVTGAGNGLGRSHALALAARGAKVLVNDLGGARDGQGASSTAADSVVEEIRRQGGEARASGADVALVGEVQSMVAEVLDTWGRVDILINNAGILRDRSFLKTTEEDFRAVLEVHLMGSFYCTQAVWSPMRKQGYGRIVMTTSSSGLYGNFGQANYGSAKMALVGLMNTLVLEGHKYDIRVNCLAPAAATRMTEDLLPGDVLALMAPELVTPGVLVLVGEEAPNRTILAAGAGSFACTRIYETRGVHLAPELCTPEKLAELWESVEDPTSQEILREGGEQGRKFLNQAGERLARGRE